MREFTRFFAGGSWVEPASRESIAVTNPTTEAVVASVPLGAADDAERCVAAAKAAFPLWSTVPVARRAAILKEVAERMRERVDEVADLVTEELGMPRDQAVRYQAMSAVTTFEMASDVVAGYSFEVEADGFVVARDPVGVVGAITPWNYPLNQIGAKVAYALAAGCTVVLKPSEVVPSPAFVLAEVLADCGLPAGTFNLVTGLGEIVGEHIVRHGHVDMVSFTGSTAVGQRVAELAAQSVTRVSLELGGKSASILLDDADFDAGVAATLGSCFLNSGQTCSAWTRLLVPRPRLGEVEEICDRLVSQHVVGPPTDAATTLGPVVSERQMERVQAYIQSGSEDGARLVVGGPGRPPGVTTGYFVRPTVFSDVTPEMRIAREEIFGPVLSLMPYDSDDEAVEIANSTEYGLSGGVAGEPARALRVARRLRTGQVRVNGAAPVRRAPFGGYGRSGYGREHGVQGLEEFLEVKALIA